LTVQEMDRYTERLERKLKDGCRCRG